MTESTALAKTDPAAAMTRRQNSIAKVDMRELKELAEVFVASGAFSDIKQVAQAQIKILAGNELGFSPIVSMTGIHFFQGKVSIGSNLIASLIKESAKYDYEVIEHTGEACAAQFYALSGSHRVKLGVPVRYTYAEANAAGLTSKDTWKKYPADLLFAAVIRQGARRYCADVLRGTTASVDTSIDPELEQIAAEPETTVVEGDVVDVETGEVIEEAAPAADVEPPVAPDEVSLVDLRDAVLSSYNATKGPERERANKLLGSKTIRQLDADGLNAFLKEFPF